MRKKDTKIYSVSYRFDKDTYEKIKILAKDDRRSLTNLIENLVDNEFREGIRKVI